MFHIGNPLINEIYNKQSSFWDLVQKTSITSVQL